MGDISTVLLKITIFVVVAQLLVIFFLFIVYVKNLFSHQLYQYILEKYEYYIMEASLGKIEKDSPLFRTTLFIRNILRVIILDKIMSVGGDARKGLALLYKELGFEKRDMRLLNSKKWYHRISAITALTITKSEALKNFLNHLAMDRHISVRISLIKAVIYMCGTDTIKEVVACMAEMPDWVNERLVPVILKAGKLPYERIKDIFDNANARVKRYLVPLIFESDSEQALWDLTNKFDEYDLETKISIVKSLSRVGSIDKIIGFVENIMKADIWELRAQLVKSLGLIRDEKSIPYLIAGLDDKNWFVRFNSAISIAQFQEKGLGMLGEFAKSGSGFKSDISRYILDLNRYGFLGEEMKG